MNHYLSFSLFAALLINLGQAPLALAAPIPEGEFSAQALRQGVVQAKSPNDCDQVFPAVLQSMQACAAYRAAGRNECGPLVPPAARNLCFATVRARTAEPCDEPGVISVRERACVGARAAESGEGCGPLSGYALLVCAAYQLK